MYALGKALPNRNVIPPSDPELRNRVGLSLLKRNLNKLWDGADREDLLIEEVQELATFFEGVVELPSECDLSAAEFKTIKPKQGRKSWMGCGIFNNMVDLIREEQKKCNDEDRGTRICLTGTNFIDVRETYTHIHTYQHPRLTSTHYVQTHSSHTYTHKQKLKKGPTNERLHKWWTGHVYPQGAAQATDLEIIVPMNHERKHWIIGGVKLSRDVATAWEYDPLDTTSFPGPKCMLMVTYLALHLGKLYKTKEESPWPSGEEIPTLPTTEASLTRLFDDVSTMKRTILKEHLEILTEPYLNINSTTPCSSGLMNSNCITSRDDVTRILSRSSTPSNLNPTPLRQAICTALREEASENPHLEEFLHVVEIQHAVEEAKRSDSIETSDTLGMNQKEGAAKYLERMGRDCEWGDEMEMNQLAKTLENTIIVYEYPIEGEFKLRYQFNVGAERGCQFLLRTNPHNDLAAHYQFMVPSRINEYRPQLSAALSLVQTEPAEIRMEYGPEQMEFAVFGIQGDGNCLFTSGELMRKSQDPVFLPGGKQFSNVWTRTVPEAPKATQTQEDMIRIWRAQGRMRSLASSAGHAYAESSVAFVRVMFELRKQLGLETEGDGTVTADLGAGVGAFLFHNAAVTCNPTIGVEQDPNTHEVLQQIHAKLWEEQLEIGVASRNMSAQELMTFAGIRNIYMYDGHGEVRKRKKLISTHTHTHTLHTRTHTSHTSIHTNIT